MFFQSFVCVGGFVNVCECMCLNFIFHCMYILGKIVGYVFTYSSFYIYIFSDFENVYVFMLIFWIQIVYHLCLFILNCEIVCLVELHVYVSGFDRVFCWIVYLLVWIAYIWIVVWMFIYEYMYVIWNCNHVFVVFNYEFQCVCIM